MAIKIVPSIIGENFEEVATKFKEIEGLVEWAQVDVVDGLFATQPTWPFKHHEEISKLHTLARSPHDTKIEVHLMIENPEPTIDAWFASGASRVLVHYEATDAVNELLGHCEAGRIRGNGFDGSKITKPPAMDGLVLKLETPIEVLEHLAKPPRFIQLMSIDHVGGYGAPFNDAVYPRIEYVRRKFPHATLSIDGGVNLDNAPQLIAAGADQLVVGSAIWKSGDIGGSIRQFQKIHE